MPIARGCCYGVKWSGYEVQWSGYGVKWSRYWVKWRTIIHNPLIYHIYVYWCLDYQEDLQPFRVGHLAVVGNGSWLKLWIFTVYGILSSTTLEGWFTRRDCMLNLPYQTSCWQPLHQWLDTLISHLGGCPFRFIISPRSPYLDVIPILLRSSEFQASYHRVLSGIPLQW